jgi:hypothetical protein
MEWTKGIFLQVFEGTSCNTCMFSELVEGLINTNNMGYGVLLSNTCIRTGS